MGVADWGGTYLQALGEEFRNQRGLAERALAQLAPDQFSRTLDAESNSVEILMRHVGGNLASRFRDFLTSDGEKPDRDRDAEFVRSAGDDAPDVAWRAWRTGWGRLEDTLETLRPEDLDRTITVRGQPHTVVRALERSLAHTAHHVGQIVFLAKHLRAGAWRTLSIARGQSRAHRPPSDPGPGVAPGV